MIKIEKSSLPKNGEFKYFDFPEYKNEIIVYRTEDSELKIYSSFCPHFGGPLSIKHGRLYCWFHAYEFSLDDGSCVNRKANLRCNVVEFKDAGQVIELEV